MASGQNIVDYIMQLRQRAGAQPMNSQQDDAIHGPDPRMLEMLRNTLQNRVNAGRQMPLPQDVYMDLARRAGDLEEAKRRAAAMFAAPQIANPSQIFRPGEMMYGPAEATGTNRYPTSGR